MASSSSGVRVLWIGWLVACRDRPLVCPDADAVPITGDVPDATVLDDVREALVSFGEGTGRPICLSEIVFQAGLRGEDDLVAGQIHPGSRVMRIDPDLTTGPDVLRGVVWHELCHLLDHDEGITEREPDLFTPTDGWFDPEHYPTEAEIRGEYFARWCGYGPLPPVVVAVEDSCGSPARLVDEEVWRGAPALAGTGVEVVGPPPVVLERVAEYEGWRVLVDDALLVRAAPPEWVPIDAPTEAFGVSPPVGFVDLDETIPGDGELWWVRGTDDGPLRVRYDGTSSETALEARPWRGGWGDGKLWLWTDEPDSDLVIATGDGEELGRAPLPQPTALRRKYTDWDGVPAMVTLGRDETRVVALPTGATLETLPGPMVPRRRVDELVVGTYHYALATSGLVVPTFDLPPNLHLADFRFGEVWVSDDGAVVASSECATATLPGGVVGHVPAIAYEDATTTVLYDAVTTWPVR
jgi:hypothetical protein